MRHRLRTLRLLLSQPPLSTRDQVFLAASAIGLAAAVATPFWSSTYVTIAMRDALILAIFALSYDLLWGKAATLTLGHSVFFGIGAYGMAIATARLGWTSLGGLLLAMACAGLLAAVIGYLLLYAGVRLHFFAIITMAVLLIVRQLATSWQSVTGGDVGILGVPGLKLSIAGIESDFGSDRASYFVVVVALALTLLSLWLLLRGHYGKVLAAIGMNEFRAKHCGYKTSFHLQTVYVGSAVLAGFSGALYAAVSGVVAPDLFSLLLATEVILWVAIGGRGSLLGPVIATVVFTRLQQEISSYSTELWPLILGILFLVMILLLPRGATGLLTRLDGSRLLRWRPTPKGTP